MVPTLFICLPFWYVFYYLNRLSAAQVRPNPIYFVQKSYLTDLPFIPSKVDKLDTWGFLVSHYMGRAGITGKLIWQVFDMHVSMTNSDNIS